MFKKLTAAVADRSGIQPCVRPFRFYEIDKGIGLTQRGKTAHRASIATKFTSSAGTAGRVAAAPALLLGQFQEPPVVFANLARLRECACAFRVKAAEVTLDITDVEFEVASDDVGVILRGLRVTRDERPNRGATGFCSSAGRHKHCQ